MCTMYYYSICRYKYYVCTHTIMKTFSATPMILKQKLDTLPGSQINPYSVFDRCLPVLCSELLQATAVFIRCLCSCLVASFLSVIHYKRFFPFFGLISVMIVKTYTFKNTESLSLPLCLCIPLKRVLLLASINNCVSMHADTSDELL